MMSRRVPAVALFLALATHPAGLYAQPVTNGPQPIVERLTVQPIIVSNTDGTNTATYLGDAASTATIQGFVNTIYAQAGVEVVFLTPTTWNNTFANVGTTGSNNPRPQTDLDTVVSTGTTAGVTSANPNALNMFLVRIPAGFGPLPTNASAGLAFLGGNGNTLFVGTDLVGPFGVGGQTGVARVVAHELGHNLGLPHQETTQNLMQASGSGERLDAAQITTILASPFTVPVPEPGTVLAAAAAGLAGARRLTRPRRAAA